MLGLLGGFTSREEEALEDRERLVACLMAAVNLLIGLAGMLIALMSSPLLLLLLPLEMQGGAIIPGLKTMFALAAGYRRTKLCAC